MADLLLYLSNLIEFLWYLNLLVSSFNYYNFYNLCYYFLHGLRYLNLKHIDKSFVTFQNFRLMETNNYFDVTYYIFLIINCTLGYYRLSDHYLLSIQKWSVLPSSDGRLLSFDSNFAIFLQILFNLTLNYHQCHLLHRFLRISFL